MTEQSPNTDSPYDNQCTCRLSDEECRNVSGGIWDNPELLINAQQSRGSAGYKPLYAALVLDMDAKISH